MSPWHLLGWILVVLVLVGIAVGLVLLTISIVALIVGRIPKWKHNRKRKRADQGKVTCEAVEYEGVREDRVRVVCPETAMWRGGYGYSQYLCDAHHNKSRDRSAPLKCNPRYQQVHRNLPTVVRSPRTTNSPGGGSVRD